MMAKRKRHRVIYPVSARAAVGGGISGFYSPSPAPGKCCGKCQQPRYSVDDTGTCGYCRAIGRAKREGSSE